MGLENLLIYVIIALFLLIFIRIVVGVLYKKTKSKQINAETKDYFEGSAWSDYDYKILKKDIEIDYTDMNGQQTIRKFSIEKYFFADDISEWFVQGYCHLRKGNRTFRISRMNSVTDLETGEYISNNINDYFQDLYSSSDFFAYEVLCKEYENELDVLLYLSKLDGRFTKKEKDIIVDFILQDFDGDEEVIRDYFFNHLFKYGDTDVSQSKAIRSVKNIKKSGDYRVDNLLLAITKISNSVKSQNPVAEAGIEFIRQKLQ